MSQGGNVLLALQTRLLKIKTANGYPITVQQVEINKGEITFQLPSMVCPYIQVLQVDEVYTAEVGGYIDIETHIILRLVLKQDATDVEMEEFKSCVVRCIYADNYNATLNAGVSLNNTIIYPKLISCAHDCNAIEANRIAAMHWMYNRKTQTWKF